VGKVACYGLANPDFFRIEVAIILFAIVAFRSALGLAYPFKWVLVSLSPEVNRQDRRANHLPLTRGFLLPLPICLHGVVLRHTDFFTFHYVGPVTTSYDTAVV
jgi:hypothetical protein